ncbi:DoxX family protein [Cellulosimicrobium arenosum]|uniref:DoxX family protein n=1 Tax=Cellulosimicrobium arenosum TaxID=2708133 RepID=A0A927IYQ4_9MICO|nr:hypothetical protein [Cellulosimicrobium arenosum]MBD8077634.1 hypothetical protein [Cellulosimicrobium arenosum]
MDRHVVSAAALTGLLAGAGVLHVVRPQVFEPLIPDALGSPRAWVVGSGIAEIACGAAVAVPATRRLGAVAGAALFVGVFPGNVKMALDSHPGARAWARRPAIAWGRLPLQVPLVAWALAVARHATSGTTTRPA